MTKIVEFKYDIGDKVYYMTSTMRLRRGIINSRTFVEDEERESLKYSVKFKESICYSIDSDISQHNLYKSKNSLLNEQIEYLQSKLDMRVFC